MTQDVQTWLPPEAAAHEAVQTRIREAVADWSGRWFARRRVGVRSAASARQAVRGDRERWVLHGGPVALACSRRAADRLLGWALDADLDDGIPTAVDRLVLEGFERRLTRDLITSVEAALHVAGPTRPTPEVTPDPLGRFGGLVVALEDDRGDDVAALAVPLSAVVAICKAGAGRALQRGVVMGSLREALGETRVALASSLGRSEISLGDLGGLAVGDVLVLDTALDEGPVLTAKGSETVIANGKLTSLDGQLALALASRP